MDTIIGRANGTTFLEISKANFRPIPMLVPSPAVLNSFKTSTAPMYDRITNNIIQNATLTALRDRYLETHRGSLEANTLDTAELHFKHLARIRSRTREDLGRTFDA